MDCLGWKADIMNRFVPENSIHPLQASAQVYNGTSTTLPPKNQSRNKFSLQAENRISNKSNKSIKSTKPQIQRPGFEHGTTQPSLGSAFPWRNPGSSHWQRRIHF